MNDKFLGIIGASTKAIADSARSMESLAEMLESEITTQNALLSTLIDKLDKLANAKGGGGGKGGKKGPIASFIGGLGGDDMASAADNIGTLGKNLGPFAAGAMDLAKAIKVYAEIPPDVSKMMVDVITNLAKELSSIDLDSIERGGEVLRTMANGIGYFGLVLGLSALIFLIAGPIAAIAIIPVLGLFAYTFYLIGKAEEEIKAGAAAIGWMGLGLLIFGLSMLVVQQFGGGSIENFIKGALVTILAIAVFGLVFDLLGKLENQIQQGAVAVTWMGLSIGILALGMAAWDIFNITIKSVLIATAAVVGIGLAYALIAYTGVAPMIQATAISIIFAGLSLIALALGIGSFQLFGITWEGLGLATAAVAFVGGAFALVGFVAPMILASAVALTIAGVAMISLSLGLIVMQMIYNKAMNGILAPSWQDPTQTNLELMINSVVKAFSISIGDSIAMGIGSVALIMASVAMLTLTAGVFAFGLVVKSDLWKPSSLPMFKGTSNIEAMIGSIVKAFSINLVDTVLMAAGSVALILASVALLTLTVGVFAFSLLVKNDIWKESSLPMFKGKTNLEMMIGTIVNAFSINLVDTVLMALGATALNLAAVSMMILTPGIFLIGLAWKKNVDLFSPSKMDPKLTNMQLMFKSIVDAMALGPVKLFKLYASLPAWLAVGFDLMLIGRGVANFIKIYQAGIDPKVLGDGLKVVLLSVVNAIIDAGHENKTVNWKQVKKGIKAISGIGNIVSGLADGVQKFAELKIPKYDESGKIIGYVTLNDATMERVAENIKLMITAVAGTLIEVGKTNGETGWFSKSDGEKGADAIRGISEDLKGIAEFVEMAADLRMPKYDANGKLIEGETVEITPDMLGPGGKVSENIKLMITSLTDVLQKVGNKEAESEGWFRSGDIEKGKKTLLGIGKDINDIAQATLAFAKVQDVDTVAEKMRMVLTALPNVLVGPDGKTGVASIIEPNKQKIMVTLGLLGQIVKPFTYIKDLLMKSKGMEMDAGMMLGKNFADLINSISEATSNPNMQLKKLDPLAKFIKDLAKVANPIDKLAKAFGKITDNMEKWPKIMKKMDKQALSKHKLVIDSMVIFSRADAAKLKNNQDVAKELVDYLYAPPPKRDENPGTPPENPPNKPPVKGEVPVKGNPLTQPKADMNTLATKLDELIVAINDDLPQAIALSLVKYELRAKITNPNDIH